MANNKLLASDNFASGSLASGWSAWPGLSEPTVLVGSPNIIEPTAVSTSDGVYWTGLTWQNDQIVEVTINNLANTGNATITLGARIFPNVGGNPQGYQAVLNPTAGTAVIQKVSGGTTTTLTSLAVTIANGDVWTFAAIGSVLFLQQNNVPPVNPNYITDSSFIASGPGTPGVSLTSNSTAASSAQVSSVRLYGVQQQDGIWTKQGCILPGTATEMGGSPSGNSGLSVNFGASVFLNIGHNVYRGYWVYYNSTTPEVAYGESLDGINWSRYASNPVISGYGGGCVSWIGGTAYMWGSSSPGIAASNFFTSTDGVTWTNHGTSTGLTVTNYGTYGPFAVTSISGTFYGLLAGLSTINKSSPASFLVTSTGGLTWTVQSSGNPVFMAFAGANMFQIGNTYYVPAVGNQPGQGNTSLTSNFDPQEGVLYQSTDLIHWSINSIIQQNSLISDSLNSPLGGCAPLCIVDVNGTAYHYYQGSPSDAVSPADDQCMLATAPVGIPRASVVQRTQTATVQIASDNFSYGPGSLSPNWTTPTWSTALQVVTGPYVESTLTSGARCTALYTGTSFGPSQYSEVTIQTLSGTTGQQFLYLLVLGRTTGTQHAYYATIPCPTGTLLPFAISKTVNGVQTNLSVSNTATTQFTPHVGDVIRFAVTQGSDGSNILTIFQNGFQILMAQDYAASITSGFPGMQLNATTLADNQVSLWAGGNANVIPIYPAGYTAFLAEAAVQAVELENGTWAEIRSAPQR